MPVSGRSRLANLHPALVQDQDYPHAAHLEFVRLRDVINGQLARLSADLKVFDALNDEFRDRPDVVAEALGFWHSTRTGLLQLIILRIWALASDSDRRSATFPRLLCFVECNIHLFGESALRRRLHAEYDVQGPEYWNDLIERDIRQALINSSTLRDMSKRFDSIKPILKRVNARRNKLIAHLDLDTLQKRPNVDTRFNLTISEIRTCRDEMLAALKVVDSGFSLSNITGIVVTERPDQIRDVMARLSESYRVTSS